ncbi:vinorine synthase-like [Melia azedarach]|uniref:Vinorine synthase-like n=1 Tax=Melia azedarach TaxID=155640 RepID=A0ACC1Y145_MELAZ|nr:vinorine synthase-like [Melia azedarach]
MVADGTAFSSFIKSWAAATARKNIERAMHPKFNASSLFPQNPAYTREVCTSTVFTSHIKFEKFVTRRFVFDASAIANLKAKATSSNVQNPSRLLGKCIMPILKGRSGNSNKPFLLNHAVNLRRRVTPPFSDVYDIGNFVWMASVLCDNHEAELHSLVSQLREEISKLNGDFVNSLQGDGGLLKFLKAVKHERETCTSAADNIVFSSWCNFGFYGIDFRWGKPAWASIYGVDKLGYSGNLIMLMDTRVGNGIGQTTS